MSNMKDNPDNRFPYGPRIQANALIIDIDSMNLKNLELL